MTDVNLSLEGKFSDKITYIFTTRKTLFDVLMIAASGLSDGGDYFISYGFHDVNFKSVWKINSLNTISMNLFQGDDYLKIWYKKVDLDFIKFKNKSK